jgi:dolichol kinase
MALYSVLFFGIDVPTVTEFSDPSGIQRYVHQDTTKIPKTSHQSMVPRRPYVHHVEFAAWLVLTAWLRCKQKSLAGNLTLIHLVIRKLWEIVEAATNSPVASETTVATAVAVPSSVPVVEHIQHRKKIESRHAAAAFVWRNETVASSKSSKDKGSADWETYCRHNALAPKKDSPNDDNTDTAGMYMSIALGPVLLQAMNQSVYATLMAAILATISWKQTSSPQQLRPNNHHCSPLLWQLGILSLAIAIDTPTTLNVHNLAFHDAVSVVSPYILFPWLWYLWYRQVFQYPSLHGVCTKGEWLLLSSAGAVATTEWLVSWTAWNATNGTESSAVVVFALTAATGLLASAVACCALVVQRPTVPSRNAAGPLRPPPPPPWHKTQVAFQLAAIATLTLSLVEACFWLHPMTRATMAQTPFPKCLWWIFADFLLATEQPLVHSAILGDLLWPRWAWLLYWSMILLVTIPLAPQTNAHAVVARKWFHFVAVLLFAPATLFAPQLQSLSYAVALALLLLLECTRHDLPWLNDFYVTYLDTSKEESQDSTILSHMALIVGCAMPLWVSQWATAAANETIRPVQDEAPRTVVACALVRSVLLPLWGVWTLGVGDAMGAMIGKHFGRWHWGYNRRTVEGSLAMFASLCACCYVTGTWLSPASPRLDMVRLWLPAVALVTVLEAFTLQIDNFVLPLAGAAIIFIATKS